MLRLFGILYLDDKRTNIDSKGNLFKKFKSFYNPSEELLIKTKKQEMHRTFCIINTNDNSINEYINCDKFNDFIYEKMGTTNWSMKINNLINKNNKINKINKINDYLTDITPNRINYDANIISIDPDGCIDIDDAISYKLIDDKIEIGIHIADPSSYIDLKSELGKELINRCESIYLNKTNHMIPESLGIEYISLKKNKVCRAYSLIINFNTNNINNISECIQNKQYEYKFIKTNIIISENLSYDNFEKQLNNIYYKNLYDIGIQIFNGLNISVDKFDYDSHKMIEGYMLLCNHFASNHTSIKRINTIKKNNNQLNNSNNNKQLYNHYQNCLQNTATYSFEDKIHEGIGLKYTHFTSPMRRYIDFLNHIIIYNNFNNQNNDDIYDVININQINQINKIHSYYKKIYNLRNIDNLLGNNQFITKDGIIVFIENNNLRILIDKILINIRIFDNKLIENKIIEILEQNETYIIFRYRNKEIKFELFQDINIKIYRNKLEINQFKFIINDIIEMFE
jgi:hypothetical protein